ncbi:MAG: VOC family protein [Alphaproteobacteria bacterium]|nr:VOC family protein [Alphaproteobacteria bacterium]
MADAAERGFKVRALGEIAIRCADLEAMSAFYRDIIGLDHLSGDVRDGIVFFKIAEGFGGHTAVLALFRPDAGRRELHPRSIEPPMSGARSSLHHLALSLPFAEQDAVMRWYERNGVDYRVQIFDWIGWRGIFATDPEGNTVELVAYDPSLLAEDTAGKG